jgi:hypothetical protein
MAGENERLSLSEEAQRVIDDANARAKAAEARAEELSQTVQRLVGTVQKSGTDVRIAELKSDGFTEERGFGGLLAYARKVYLADDGEPALQSDSFSTDDNKTGELSLSQVVDGFFAAFKRGEDGKLALGEQIVQPPESVEGETEGKDEAKAKEKLSDGKPGGKEGEEEEVNFADLLPAEQDALLAKELEGTPLAGKMKVEA